MSITDASLKLFIALANAAGDWNGEPLFEGGKAERGNLTQLKRTGLVTSFTDEGCTFVSFTDAGKALAADHGIEL
jgi:hypothetical protein